MNTTGKMFETEREELDLRNIPSVKGFDVKPVVRKKITWFIEKWHYSGNMNGVKSEYCFGLYWKNYLVGAAVFAKPATRGVAEAYNQDGNLVLTELRRLCCIDNTPKNTESYFIGAMLRWLEKHTDVDIVLAYSDLTHGHEGTIYKATNFKHVGQSPAFEKIKYKGKLYHDRSLRVRYNGKLKPFSRRLANAVKEGKAERVSTKPKNIYTFRIKRNKEKEKTILEDNLTQPKLL